MAEPAVPMIGSVPVKPDWRVAALVDLETTGFSPQWDEVIEASVALFAFTRHGYDLVGILDQYTGLQMVDTEIDSEAARVHGISAEELVGQALDLDRMRAILRRAEFIVAHNSSFDRAFLRHLVPEVESQPWLCTMRGIDWKGHGFESRRLGYLLDAHGIEPEREHRAGADVISTLQLLSMKNDADRTYLQDLVDGLVVGAPKGKRVKPTRAAEGPLVGEIVVVTGTMAQWTREEIEGLIESLGGNSNGSVSKKTTLVVAGPGAGSKLTKARELGIRVVNEEEFIKLISQKPARTA